MPMGAENAAPTFAAMMKVLEQRRNARAKAAKPSIKDCGSRFIINDVMLFGMVLMMLLCYFEVMPEVLQHYQATMKLKKCVFLDSQQEFVGIDVMDKGNAPAQLKYKAFQAVCQPKTFWICKC